MESTLPSLDMLRLIFLRQNPGYKFGLTESGIECPVEKDGFCRIDGIRYWQWIGFIKYNSINIAKEVGMNVPNIIDAFNNPYADLIMAQENYNILRQHPIFSSMIQKWRLHSPRIALK